MKSALPKNSGNAKLHPKCCIDHSRRIMGSHGCKNYVMRNVSSLLGWIIPGVHFEPLFIFLGSGNLVETVGPMHVMLCVITNANHRRNYVIRLIEVRLFISRN